MVAGLYLQCPKRWCDLFQWVDQAYDKVPYVLDMAQNSFLRIRDYKSYLLWVIIDFPEYPKPFSSLPRDLKGVLFI